MKQYWILVCFLIGLFYSHPIYSQQTNDEIIKNYSTDLFAKGKLVFVRKKNKNNAVLKLCYPISFMIEYTQNGLLKKEMIDQYIINGGCPNVQGVFLQIFQIEDMFL